MSAPEDQQKLEAFLNVSPDGWLSLSVPLNVRDGDIMAYGVLRKAEMLVSEYLEKVARLRREKGLVLS